MPMWTYLPEKRLTIPQMLLLQEDRKCRACSAHLLRVAEREADWPYRWKPCGYRCSKCNTCYMGNV